MAALGYHEMRYRKNLLLKSKVKCLVFGRKEQGECIEGYKTDQQGWDDVVYLGDGRNHLPVHKEEHHAADKNGSNGARAGAFLPEVTHYVGNKGSGSPEGEGESQQGKDVVGIESCYQGEEGYDYHGDLGGQHDLLVSGSLVQEYLEDIIAEDGARTQKV